MAAKFLKRDSILYSWSASVATVSMLCGDILIVGSVIGNEEAQVRVVEYSCNSYQTSSTTGYHSNILPGILAFLSQAMLVVVQVGDGLSQRLDARSRPVLSSRHGDIDRLWALEAPLDIIVDFGGSLT